MWGQLGLPRAHEGVVEGGGGERGDTEFQCLCESGVGKEGGGGEGFVPTSPACCGPGPTATEGGPIPIMVAPNLCPPITLPSPMHFCSLISHVQPTHAPTHTQKQEHARTALQAVLDGVACMGSFWVADMAEQSTSPFK